MVTPPTSKFSEWLISLHPNLVVGYHYLDLNQSDEVYIDMRAFGSGLKLTSFDSTIFYKFYSNDATYGKTPANAFEIGDFKIIQVFDTLYHFFDDELHSLKMHDQQIDELRVTEFGLFECLSEVGALRLSTDIENLISGNTKTVLSGFRCTDVAISKDSSVWATSLDNGIVKISSLNSISYSDKVELPKEHIQSFAFFRGKVILATRSGIIVGLNLKTNGIEKFISRNEGYKLGLITYDEFRDVLYLGSDMLINDKFEPSFVSKFPGDKAFSFGVLEPKLNTQDTLVLVNSSGLTLLDKDTRMIKSYLKDLTQYLRCYDIAPAHDKGYYVGTVEGLAFQPRLSYTFELIESTHPALSLRVQAVEEYCQTHTAIGTKGLGVAVFNTTDTIEIRKSDGLTSDMIEDLYVDSECNLWVTTLAGLNKVTFTSLDSFKIQNFTIHHGLPSNEVTQVQEHEGQMWVATTKGLITLPEFEVDSFASVPMLIDVTVHDSSYLSKASLYLHHADNAVKFEWLAIDYQQMGRVPYRYRLEQEDEWTYTQDRSVLYPQLSPGKYDFEVQRANRDGIWSESTAYSFSIKPPWWQTWWFYALATITVGGLGYAFYKWRISQVKEEAGLQQKLVELERSALQAQMNPHFIFNCLASIQNFILSNDTQQAVSYLSRFSRLVRQTLDASVEGFIFIDEEAQLLENYLMLEQQRFSDKFSFEFTVDETLSNSNARIPSMMVQPFVENAVIHGLSETSSAVRISITYDSIEDKKVLVTIEDNGPGVSSTKNSRARLEHKSVGMTITRKRLELMSQASEVNVIDLAEETGGLSTGTRVELILKRR